MKEDAPQREDASRELFNALRWFVRAGGPWRMLPNDLPPWMAVEQQAKRWLRADCFEAMAHDLRARGALASRASPRTQRGGLGWAHLAKQPGERGQKRVTRATTVEKAAKVHSAVDPLGKLLAATATPANEQERAQGRRPWQNQVQAATGQNVQLACVDQGYTGQPGAEAAAAHGIKLEVVKPDEAKRGFVLLPRRWVVERSFAWLARFRRLSRDCERLPTTLAGRHWLAFACLLLGKLFRINPQS